MVYTHRKICSKARKVLGLLIESSMDIVTHNSSYPFVNHATLAPSVTDMTVVYVVVTNVAAIASHYSNLS